MSQSIFKVTRGGSFGSVSCIMHKVFCGGDVFGCLFVLNG